MLLCRDLRTGIGCEAENSNTAQFCSRCGRPLRFALQFHDPGTVVGGYRVHHLLGHGAYGAVYEAEYIQHAAIHVAIKESFDPAGITQFQGEFTILHQLQHPHLPRYYEMFEAHGNGYLVMEFVPGSNLDDIVGRQQGPLVEAQVLGYALQLCDALSYLHRQRAPIIHRDIKPANIRLTPAGLIKLVDFGLLKQGTQHTANSRRGLTPAYAPLEQWGASGQHTDARSDIYSLGATLYHLLTGQEPVPVTDRIATTVDPLVVPIRLNSALSQHVSDAITKAMSLQAKDRYASAEQLKQALTDSQPSSRVRSAGPSPGSAPQPTVQLRRIRTLSGHIGLVTTVRWSPDGQVLASAGADRTIKLWNTSDGRLLRTLVGHTDWVTALAYSPDGTVLASASRDTSVQLWRVGDGALQQHLRGHTHWVQAVACSPDGQMIASAGTDKTIQLWRVGDGQLLSTLHGHTGWVTCLAYNTSGQLLISGSADTTVCLWHAGQGHLLRTFSGHHDLIRTVACSPDGQLIASGSSDMTVHLWRIADGSRVQTLRGHTSWINSLAFNSDRQTLITGGEDNTIRLWQIADGRLKQTWQEDTGGVLCIMVSPDGKTLASAHRDGQVRLWQLDL